MKKIADLIDQKKDTPRPKNLSTEFQEFGIYLADSLGDPKHYSLYIKYAKEYPRAILEEALSFTKGYTSAKSRAKVFMWKLGQLKNAKKD